MGLLDRFKNHQYHIEYEDQKQFNLEHSQGFKSIQPSTIREQMMVIFKQGKPRGFSTGIERLDSIMRYRRRGGLYCISAYPQAGKTAFLVFLAVMWAKGKGKWIDPAFHGPVSLYCPEEDTDDLIEMLMVAYLGKNVNKRFKDQCTPEEFNEAWKFVEENFTVLEYDGMPTFQELTMEYERKVAEGYKYFITDPWNNVAEGSMDDFGNKYLKVSLTHMKNFAKKHQVQNFIVEHQNRPKPNNKGEYPPAHVRNITGGQMYENKCDGIYIIHSDWTEASKDPSVRIETAKSKQQKYNGYRGVRTLYYDLPTGQYLQKDPRKKTAAPSEPENTDVPF